VRRDIQQHRFQLTILMGLPFREYVFWHLYESYVPHDRAFALPKPWLEVAHADRFGQEASLYAFVGILC